MSDMPSDLSNDLFDDEAEAWFARIRGEGGTQEVIAALDAWRNTDPRRAAAYRRVEMTWRAAGLLSNAPQIERLRGDVMTRTAVLPRAGRRVGTRPQAIGRWAALAAVAASIAVAVGVSVWSPPPIAPASETYRTAVGQQRRIALSDSSVVVLDTGTAVRVAFTPQERRVVVEAGQAFFEVVKDNRRPFVVEAGRGRTRAVGTAFSVRNENGVVTVTLAKGRVEVLAEGRSPSGETARPAMLSAGDRVVYARTGSLEIQHVADMDSALSWADGVLVFNATPLPEALKEFNRYTRTQVRLSEEPELQRMRINGVYRVGDQEAFLNAVAAISKTQATRAADDVVVLRRARGA